MTAAISTRETSARFRLVAKSVSSSRSNLAYQFGKVRKGPISHFSELPGLCPSGTLFRSRVASLSIRAALCARLRLAPVPGGNPERLGLPSSFDALFEVVDQIGTLPNRNQTRKNGAGADELQELMRFSEDVDHRHARMAHLLGIHFLQFR